MAAPKKTPSFNDVLVNALNDAEKELELKYFKLWKSELNPLKREELHNKLAVISGLVQIMTNNIRNNKLRD